jgi:protein phosphatase
MARSAWKNVMWNVIGGGTSELEPEVSSILLEPDDCLLLCTDGLTRHVTDPKIAAFLLEDRNPESCCRRLVDEANRAGGKDNITVLIARFHEKKDPLESAVTETSRVLMQPPS